MKTNSIMKMNFMKIPIDKVTLFIGHEVHVRWGDSKWFFIFKSLDNDSNAILENIKNKKIVITSVQDLFCVRKNEFLLK